MDDAAEPMGPQSRRLWWLVVPAGVVVAGVVAGLAGGVGDLPRGPADLPPTQGQWVGMRHVAIEVGADWAHGRACDEHGTARSYTVHDFRFVDPHCEGGRETPQEQEELVSFTPLDADAAADEAHLAQAPGNSDTPVHETTIDGVRALRSEVHCTEIGERTSGTGFEPATVRRCTAALALPGEGVEVHLWSIHGEKSIERLLDSVRVLDDHVAVPGAGGTLQEYRAEASDLGLTVDITSGDDPGPAAVMTYVAEVDPGPGRFVPVGSTVGVAVRQ